MQLQFTRVNAVYRRHLTSWNSEQIDMIFSDMSQFQAFDKVEIISAEWWSTPFPGSIWSFGPLRFLFWARIVPLSMLITCLISPLLNHEWTEWMYADDVKCWRAEIQWSVRARNEDVVLHWNGSVAFSGLNSATSVTEQMSFCSVLDRRSWAQDNWTDLEEKCILWRMVPNQLTGLLISARFQLEIEK